MGRLRSKLQAQLSESHKNATLPKSDVVRGNVIESELKCDFTRSMVKQWAVIGTH